MERVVWLCQAGCPGGCPSVEITQNGAIISETDKGMTLSREQWNLLVEKVKSGELPSLEEMELGEAGELFSCCGD